MVEAQPGDGHRLGFLLCGCGGILPGLISDLYQHTMMGDEREQTHAWAEVKPDASSDRPPVTGSPSPISTQLPLYLLFSLFLSFP